MPWLPSLNQIALVTKHRARGSSIRAMNSLICPRCGRNDVRWSIRRSFGDRIIACFGLAPYRCRSCRYRFFRFPMGAGNAPQPTADVPPQSAPAQTVTVPSVSDELSVTAQPVAAQPLDASPLTENLLASVPIARSLLILSPDPAMRRLLCKFLAQPGYHTHELADAVQLPAELRARKVDLLIADLDLPEQQGLETVASLRSMYPNLKIIALSGLRVAGVPGSIILPKPFHRELLLESVQNALVDAPDSRLPPASVHA
jgi:CheY-like chemotaxis protein